MNSESYFPFVAWCEMQFGEFNVCSGCLATDTRMVDTRQHSASDFTRLVELLPTAKAGLPPCVCYECLAQLTKMRDFHAKNQRAYNVLLKIIQQRGRIKEADIKQIDRTQQNLASALKFHQIESISIDPKIFYSYVAVDDVNDEITPELTEVKIEFKLEKKIKSEGLFEDFNNFSADEPEEVKNTDFTQKNNADKENVKETEPTKVKIERKKDTDVKNTTQKSKKRKASNKNSELKPAAESQNLPKVGKKRTPGKLLKVNPTKSYYTQDYHSFATVTVMTEEERLEVFKRRSEKQQYIDADYKCTECYLVFNCTKNYEKHRKRHDPNAGAYVCPLCKCRYKTQELQKKHIAMHHRTKFECKSCPYVCTNGDRAKIHSNKHSSATYRCKKCNYISAQRASYDLHVSTMHGEETPCPCCGVSFLDLGAMRAHMDAAHPKPVRRKLRCECGANFYNSEARKLHQSTSSKHNQDGSTLLSCALCDSRFTDKQSLQAHMLTHPQERKEPAQGSTSINCDQCGEATADREAYKTHYRLVHPDKTITCIPSAKYTGFLCDICGKTFKGTHSLKVHKFLHTGLHPYECKICSKTFAQRVSFDQHMNTHTKRNVYKCNVCGKGFNQSSNRKRHMLVHTEEKLFPCDICGKSFKSRVDMLSHIRYVHLKKPWPKRDRNKRKPTQQQQCSDQDSSD